MALRNSLSGIALLTIYALEPIARASTKARWPIMEVLTADVRVHVPADEADNNIHPSHQINSQPREVTILTCGNTVTVRYFMVAG